MGERTGGGYRNISASKGCVDVPPKESICVSASQSLYTRPAGPGCEALGMGLVWTHSTVSLPVVKTRAMTSSQGEGEGLTCDGVTH